MKTKNKNKKDMPFGEYYKHYLKKHTNLINRRLHVIGQLTTIGYVTTAIYLAATHNLGWLLLLIGAPFVVYPFAWSGHFFFEKNKPAAFKNPWKAKAADWVMLKDILLGRIKLF